MMDGLDQLPMLYLGFTIVLGGILVGGAWIIIRAVRSTRPQAPETATSIAPARTSHTLQTTAVPVVGGAVLPLPADAAAEIDRLLADGQKVVAIKLYRDHTGVGLKEAKDRVESWAPGSALRTPPLVAPRSDALSPRALSPRALSPRASLPPEVAAEVDRLVAAEQKISAIKLLREYTGLGLKESKDHVESWAVEPRL
ncbi:MAG: ribosomal protein L7/L12 [Microbacterium sp.]|nr:ribosomal protein L7/L12 [Microbacterium sp.]